MNNIIKTIILPLWLLTANNIIAQDSLNSALLDATWENNLDKTKELISLGADVNTRSYDQATPLHFACANNNIEMVKLLVYKSASLNAKDSRQKTPLHICAEFGLDSIAEFLILSKADIKPKNKEGKDALYICIEKGNYVFADMMMFYGANPYTLANDSTGLIHAAVESGNLDLLIMLLDKNLNPNKEDIYDRNPLYYAFLLDDTTMVKVLLDYGAKFTEKDGIIKKSIEYSRLSMLNFILKDSTFMSGVEHKNLYNEAVRRDNKEVINLLKTAGIKGNWKPIVPGICFESNTFLNFKDHSAGFSIGVREMKSNIFLNAGYSHRLWPKRVLMTYNDMQLQLKERRGIAYFSLSKGIRLIHSQEKSLFLQTGIMEYYTWGKYDGMSTRIDGRWNMSPLLGLQYHYYYFTLSAQYVRFDFSNNLPSTYILIKCGWTIPFE